MSRDSAELGCLFSKENGSVLASSAQNGALPPSVDMPDAAVMKVTSAAGRWLSLSIVIVSDDARPDSRANPATA